MSENLFKIFDAGPEQFDRVSRLFTCDACKHDVMRGGRFMPGASDYMIFAGCECLTIAFWELETAAPSPTRWRKLLRMAKKQDAGLIVIDPGSKGGRQYGQN